MKPAFSRETSSRLSRPLSMSVAHITYSWLSFASPLHGCSTNLLSLIVARISYPWLPLANPIHGCHLHLLYSVTCLETWHFDKVNGGDNTKTTSRSTPYAVSSCIKCYARFKFLGWNYNTMDNLNGLMYYFLLKFLSTFGALMTPLGI